MLFTGHLFIQGVDTMFNIQNIKELKDLINKHPLTVVIYSTKTCSVCEPLKMKINDLLKDEEDIVFGQVYLEDEPLVQGEYGVYTAPTTVIFVEGKESKRYSRAMDLAEFKQFILRMRGLLFD